jgi:hypothetical protein
MGSLHIERAAHWLSRNRASLGGTAFAVLRERFGLTACGAAAAITLADSL